MAQAKMDFIINTKVDKTAFSELKREIQNLQALSEQDLIKMGAAPDLSSAKTQLTQIQNSAKQVETALNKAFSPKLGTVSLSKFNDELKSMNLQKIANDFQKAGAAGQTAFRDLTANVLTTKVQLKEMSPLLKEFGQTMKNTIKWGISSSALNTFTGSLQKAYSYVKNLDTSLNNIRIVAGQSADEMDRFAVKANKTAQALGKTTLDYTNAALIYYQQGTLNDAEIAERTAATLKMANVTGEAAQDVSDYMTAIWNNFYDGSKSIEYYADVMTALGAATASSTDEIAAGLEKFAAIADTVGLSYEYATAALATVTAETRQSADVVGTAFKTMFARIQDLELGETLEDGVTLGLYAEALNKIGVNVLDANGNMREMNDILNDMGAKWGSLTQAQKVATAEAVAGTRQYTQLVALMDNWDVFQTNINTAANATGTLNEQQEIYMESTRAHLNQLSASAERLYNNLIDSDGLNSLIDGFSLLVDGVSNYTEAIGGSGAVFSQLGALAMKAFGKDISQEIARTVSNIKMMTEQTEEANAQLKLMQQFKGLQINDASYTRLLEMTEQLDKYKNVLTDVQYQEAQAMIQSRNEAANDLDIWEERRQQAEAYFKIFTDNTVNLNQNPSLINVDSLTSELDNVLGDYQLKIGDIVKSFQTEFKKGDTDIIESYLDSAKSMIEADLIQNEELLKSLQDALADYKKITANTRIEDINELNDEQKEKLEIFVKAYGKAADNMVKDANKVKDTIKDAAKGTGSSLKTQIDLIDNGWKRMIDRFNTQNFAQYFTNLSGQIMMISSAISSIGNLPSIWKNEDLTTGEKILQTIMAIGNAGQGLVTTYQMIHSTAELIRGAQIKNVATSLAQAKAVETTTKKQVTQTQAIKDTTKEREKEKEIVDATETEVKEKTKALETERLISADASHKEISDEVEYASRVALSTQAIYEKNRAKGSGITSGGSDSMLPVINELMQQQESKQNIQNFLQSKGYEGLYSQIPTMTTDRLKSMTHNEAKSKRMSKLFSAISGQGHAIARDEMQDFNIENEKGVKELINFLNEQLPQNRKDLKDTGKDLKNVANQGEKTKETLEDMNGGKDPKSGGIFGGLKKDVGDIVTFFKSIPPQAYIAAAAIAAVAATIYLIAEAIETEKEKDERLQRQIDEATEAYHRATEAASELNSAISNYQSGIEGMQGLTKGTLEYYEAIVKANEAAQILIDKLGLILGTDYTIGPDGLIQIDEGVLTEKSKEAQKETHRAQAGIYSAKAEQVRESSTGINKTIENTYKDIQKILQDRYIEDPTEDNLRQLQGFTLKDAENILEVASQAGKKNNNEEIVEELKEQNSQTSDLVFLSTKNNELTKESSVNISSAIEKNLSKYNSGKAQEESLNLAAADQAIRGYGTDEQIKRYEDSTATGQNLMQQYVAKQQNVNKKDLKEVNVGASAVGGALAGAAIGATLGTVVPVIGNAIGAVGGAIVGTIGGAIGGWLGSSAAKKDQEKQLKTIYAQEALGYTVNDKGEWYDENNELISKDEQKKILEGIDLTTAKNAYESGDYVTDEALERIQTQMNTDKQNALNAKNADGSQRFDGESSRYISEAMTAARQGLDYDYSLLSEDEMAYFKEQITSIGSATGTLGAYSEALAATSDPQKRLKQDTENFNTELDAQAQALGTTSKALKLYQKSLVAAGKVESDLNKTTASAVGSTYGFNKAWNAAVDTFEDVEDAYDIWLESLESGIEPAYDVMDAVGELWDSLEQVLGFDLSEDFLANNEDLIKDFLSEDRDAAEKAYKELRQLAMEDLLANTGDYITDIKAFVNELDSLKAGDTLSTEFTNQLNTMLQNTKMTKEELENLFATMQLEMPDVENSPEWERVTETKGGTTTTHHYSGTYPTGEVDKNGKMKTADLEYSWTETVDPQEFTYWKLKDGAKTTYTKTGDSTNTSFARSWAATKKDSSGSKKEPKKEDHIEEQKDRYHDINIELKQIANELQKVQEEQENLVGSDLIANLQRQYNLLNKEIDATARKIGIARGEQEELQAKLAGNGVNFNEDGTIANYAQAWDAQLAYVNGIIDKYNNMSADAQEGYQETLDNAKEQWEKFKENVERYDTLITEDIPGLEADIRAALDQQIEIKLEAFEYEIQIRLDMSEAERDWNEFKKKIIDGIKEDDILGNAKARLKDFDSYYKADGTGEIQASTKHVNNILDQLKQMDADQAAGVYGETYTYTNANGEEVTVDYNNRKQALEDLKEYYTQIMSSMMDLQELEEEIHQSYLDMMDEAQEKFDEQLETYQTIDEIIQHDMNLVKLMYGDSAGLADYYKEQRINLDNQLDFQKQQVAFWKNQMDTLEEGSDAWEKAKENWLAAGAEWRALAETNIQVITDQYLDSITTIFETLNNNMTNGMGLDYVSKEWDLINQNADRYLDQVNSIYETQSLQNKYLDAIEQSTNPTQQKKLNELMEDEIALLQEKDKLSQYDLDRANLKYEIAMKQMALEESQQKKTQLRLRRDSQGNYTYQYTNDDSEVSKLKNELSDLYNQLYNLDAGQYKSNLDELYSVWDAFQTDMYEAAQINDPEKRKEREEMLEREYGELINGIVADNEFIKQNLQQSTASQLFDLYDQNAENYEQMTEAQKSILDNFISAETEYNNMAFDNLFGLYNENLAAFDTMTQEQIDTLMNDFIPQWDSGVQQMIDTIVGEGGFAEVIKSAMEEVRVLAKIWDEERKAAYEEAEAMVKEMQAATEELAKDNTELISTYQTQLEEVQKVIDKLGEMKLAYEQAAAAAKTAAEEAYKYWQAASNQAASTDTTIDTTDYKKPEGNTNDVNKKTNTPSTPSISNGSSVKVKSGASKFATGEYMAAWVPGNNFTVGSINGNKVLLTNPNGPNNWATGITGWVYKTDLDGFKTGGYTGDWNGSDGKLAMLHQKELVLNANDTKNILNAVEILRNITSNLGQALMSQMASISANNTSAIANTIGSDTLEQTVHIDAQFPNVRNSNEIETAINNLVNMASQHIQKN